MAQELALRSPGLVRSLVLQSTWAVPDPYYRAWMRFVRWLPEVAPDERSFLEGFSLDIYTPRAYADGTVPRLIEEVLAFPHKQAVADMQAFLDALIEHDTSAALPRIGVPTLVLAGGSDPGGAADAGPGGGRRDPGRRPRGVEDESHQPFQEQPERWNALVDAFWREVGTRAGLPRPREAATAG